MCGIVGYVGPKQAVQVLVDGLARLEYRGYDSAGVAIIGPHGLKVVRRPGKLSALSAALTKEPLEGKIGIGHTRWATHGRPSEENAHPHTAGSVTVVHNGIIENHVALRLQMEALGRRFSSETDTEVFSHLIDEAIVDGAPSLSAAVRAAVNQVEGTYAIVVLSEKFPDTIVATRNASPLVLGKGVGESFVASDVPAILEHTRNIVFLEEGDVAELHAGEFSITDRAGKAIERPVESITWSAAQAEKDGFPHFMLKEIFEQPRAVADTMRGRLLPEHGDAVLDGVELPLNGLGRIVLLACGTSYYAALIGKFLIEGLARIPCEVDLASEFRYRDPVIGPGDLVVAISQSGETADTLGAVREARARGAWILAIANVVGSAIPRVSDATFYTHAGPEIGVASTKCFTAQLTALALLALHLGRRRGLSEADGLKFAAAMASIPEKMTRCLQALAPDPKTEPPFPALAARFKNARDFLFLGRGANYPIALEGALKLKEISYIHAEGYAAGEMKHGPIALIDDGVPVVVVAPRGPGYEKVLSNLAEVQARNGTVLAVATEGDETIARQAKTLLHVPEIDPRLQPFVTVIPLQLLAYAIAVARGNDVDQPRNLAKSVTVE
ncbi:MAG TPA: glutamine--fructose-6-phosphate transaminase (isomerizing) [Polyangia bacterium]|jgi:glucosamine--fructose-6-phosphate aminotransferase (isomerizing)